MWKSKKFRVLCGSIAGLLATGITGAQPWPIVIQECIVIVLGYFAAQGVADIGKEKAVVCHRKENEK